MPSGVYIRTEESKKNMSKARKGKKMSEEHKKRISEANKNHIVSNETRKKIGDAHRGISKDNHQSGRKHSEETKKKMSEAHTGKELSEEHKRKISEANIGRKNPPCSEETRRKIGLASLGRKLSVESRKKMSEAHKGEKCTFWKGGITPENKIIRSSIEYKLWRGSVFARDNWTCQKTGEQGGKLQAHHIQNFADYPELRLAIDNGVTLSKKSHKEFHHIYGNKNNAREQLEEFLKL